MPAKVIKSCASCPNFFECPLKHYAEHRREKLCLIKRLPVQHSPMNSCTDGAIVIPEEWGEWRDRLNAFVREHRQ